MASWFTNALDKVTPWDRGGEVQRRKEKKQQEQNQPKIVRPTPNPGITTNADRNMDVIKGQKKKTTSFGTLDMPNKVAVPNKIADAKENTSGLPSNTEIALKSAGSVGTNVAGGLLGMAKGVVELPALAANATNLIGLGAAKATWNKTAEDNAQKRIAENKAANNYNKFVKPLTSRLAGAEAATDRTSQNLAPWQTENTKNATKAFTNVIPVPPAAAVVGAVAKTAKINKFNKAAKAAEEAARIAEMNKVKIPVKGGDTRGLPVPTRVATGPTIEDVTMRLPGDKPALAPTKKTKQSEPQRLIQDISGGESFPTPDALVARNIDQARREAADRFNSVDQPAIGDKAISNDVTPRTEAPTKMPDTEAERQKLIDLYAKDLKSRGEGNGVYLVPDGDPIGWGKKRVSDNYRAPGVGSKRLTKAQWRDLAEQDLRSGKADPGTQQAFNDLTNPEVQSLLAQGDQVPGSQGIPIRVKQVQGIDVQQVDNVPTNMPEVPGQVRVTTQTDPMATQTQAVAAQPTVVTPESIPIPKVGALLPDGTKVTKAMVKAARNQRKLAKQLAKTKADTQAVVDGMPELAPKPEGNPGFAPTGEFRMGKNGNVSEVAHRVTEAEQGAIDTANMSAGDVLTKATQEVTQNGLVSPESVRNMQAMLESGRFLQTSPEYRALAKTLYGAGSDYGRGLSLFNPTLRRTASGDQLTNRFVSKVYGVAEDGSRMTEGHIQAVSQADNAFTEARDAANRALDNYNATKSAEAFDAWKQARQVADEAEKHALTTEYRVANDVLKGNKNPEAMKAIEKAEQDAGVYQMDWVDANMLSGTGTGVRNYFNTSGIRLENSIFGRMAGGYSGEGAKIGNKLGNKSVVSDFKARNELDQNILNKTVRQWSTTMNTLGEGNIKAVAYSRAYKHYEKALKEQGITGDQLKRDVEVMLHSDPEQVVARYEGWAMQENALSALAHSKKIEQQLTDMIAGKGGNKAAQLAAKVAVRLTVGFPTVIGRSLVGGLKRATLGAPEAIHAAFVKGDPMKRADLLYNAKVHGGSGAMLYALGAGLAATGVISGAYPDDQAERDKWKREGRQANSINIAGNWFSVPGYFGALALPLLVPSYIKDARSPGEVTKGIADAVFALSPTDSVAKFFSGIEGRGGDAWGKNLATSAVRAVTPAGALFNQLARMTDTIKNDTTTKSDIMNLLDSIAGGIPGVNNMVNKIDATDDQGNVLHNPAVWATAVGASGQNQQAGIEDSQQMQTQANDTYSQLRDVGVLDNANLMDLVDEKVRSQIERGQDLTPEQVTEIQKTVTKGISTGITASSDSNWRENGDYATDRTARQVKLQMLEADPRAKPSDIEGLKIQIARDNVLEENQVPYETLKLYQDTTLTEWRKFANTDPETYSLLANLDDMLTGVGGSYDTDPTQNKYETKKSGRSSGSGGSGGGGRKAPKMSTEFGTLSTSGNPMAPKVRQYETANMAGTSGIPVINVVRPNIIHRIGRG